MNTHADKTQDNKSQSVANAISQKQSSGESTFQFVDNQPEAIAQRKLQEMANNSLRVMQLKAFQDMANNSPQAKQAAQLQSMADNYSAQEQQPIQKKENNTGLPDNLKTGMENLSGISLDDVKVHRNSDKPTQLQAHAYAQGTDIYLGPGQEKHLPHEAWHVVQQKQGRVKPTMQMKGGLNVNDNDGLEKEADLMGSIALLSKTEDTPLTSGIPVQAKVIQRRIPTMNREFITANKDMAVEILAHALQNFSEPELLHLIQQTTNPTWWDVPAIVGALEEGGVETVLEWSTLIHESTPQEKQYEQESGELTMGTDQQRLAILDQLKHICTVIDELITNEKLLTDIFGLTDLSFPKDVLKGVSKGLNTHFNNKTCPARILGNGDHNEWVGVGGMTNEGALQVDLSQSSFLGLAAGTLRAKATLVHEFTHAIAGTKDFAYNKGGCLKLGPKKRIMNAETYAHAWLSQIGQGKDWYFYDPERSVGKRAEKKDGGQESKLAQIRKKRFGEVKGAIAKVWNNVDNAYIAAQKILIEEQTGIRKLTPNERKVNKLLMSFALLPHEPDFSAANANMILALIEDRTKALSNVKKDLKPIVKSYTQNKLESLEPLDLLVDIIQDEMRMAPEISNRWVYAFYDPQTYMT